MALIKVPENREDEMLQEFCDTSAFTFEGLDVSDKKGWKEFEEFLKTNGGYAGKDVVAYWFKGSVMNRCYRLTGDNAYSPDLTFVVIPNFYNPMFKLSCGARWFDDIVANNCIKQHAQDTDCPPDYK